MHDMFILKLIVKEGSTTEHPHLFKGKIWSDFQMVNISVQNERALFHMYF